jgi:hypothetical protein
VCALLFKWSRLGADNEFMISTTFFTLFVVVGVIALRRYRHYLLEDAAAAPTPDEVHPAWLLEMLAQHEASASAADQ